MKALLMRGRWHVPEGDRCFRGRTSGVWRASACISGLRFAARRAAAV